MEKLKLKLNSNTLRSTGSTLGMRDLLGGLANSDIFEISHHTESISTMRGDRATIIYCNDKKVYLDLWEYPTPSHSMEIYNSNFDLIIKVQHSPCDFNTYNNYCNRKGIMKPVSVEDKKIYWNKFVPWTFFPSRLMFNYVKPEQFEIKQLGFFCGKPWKCRHGMIKALPQQGIECIDSDQAFRSGRPLSDEDYLKKMETSKYGIVLRGRSTKLTDCKNRREIDYMIMRKPLLLDYEPNYYNPLIKGKHYILIDEKTDINSIDKLYNVDEIEKNAYEWYLNNASMEAIPKTFFQIMTEKLKLE